MELADSAHDVLQVRDKEHIPSMVNHLFFELFVHQGRKGGIFKKTLSARKKKETTPPQQPKHTKAKTTMAKPKDIKKQRLGSVFQGNINIESIEFVYPLGNEIVFLVATGEDPPLSVVRLVEAHNIMDEEVKGHLMNFLKSVDSVIGRESKMYNTYFDGNSGRRKNKRISLGGQEPFYGTVKRDRQTSKLHHLLPQMALEVFDKNMEVGMGSRLEAVDDTGIVPFDSEPDTSRVVEFSDKLARADMNNRSLRVYCPSIPEDTRRELTTDDVKSKLLFLNVGMKVCRWTSVHSVILLA